MIRATDPDDAGAIAAICNHYIAGDHRMLRAEPIPVPELASHLAALLPHWPALVVEQAGRVVGYAHAGEWSGPAIHPATVETSVYLAPEACGRGLGRALYAALLERLAARGPHVAVGVVTLPNDASRALHAALGFRPIATLAGAADKRGRRFDVECWARSLGEDGE